MKNSNYLMLAAFMASATGLAFGQVSSVAPNYTGDPTFGTDEDEYQHDDGSTENLLGWTAGGTMGYIQWFEADGGVDTITAIRLINGSALYPNYGNGNGSPVSVGVWSDPNGDGHPSDAVLLARVDTTVENIDTDTFQTVPLDAPVEVNGRFFIGGWIAHSPGQFVAPMDQSSLYVNGTAYIFGSNNSAQFNPELPGSPDNELGISEMGAIGYPSFFCVRANAGGGGGFSLAVSGACPGSMQFDASGATPGGNVAFVYAFGTGNVVIPSGPCAGTALGLNGTATLGGTDTADGSGNATLSANVPPAACGRVFVQALDVSSCTPSNVLGI